MRVIDVTITTSSDKVGALRIALNTQFELIELESPVKVVGFTIVGSFIKESDMMSWHPPKTYEVLVHVENTQGN